MKEEKQQPIKNDVNISECLAIIGEVCYIMYVSKETCIGTFEAVSQC